MSDPHPTPAQTEAAAARATEAQVVAELTRTLELQPGDRVSCVRVFGDFYRCNWWAPGHSSAELRMIEGLRASTYRIRKSRFLRVTSAAGGVIIQDVTRTGVA